MPEPGEIRYSGPGWHACAELGSGPASYRAKRQVPQVIAITLFVLVAYVIDIARVASERPPIGTGLTVEYCGSRRS